MARHSRVELVEVELAGHVADLPEVGAEALEYDGSLVGRVVIPHDHVVALLEEVGDRLLKQVAVVVAEEHPEGAESAHDCPAGSGVNEYFGFCETKVTAYS